MSLKGEFLQFLKILPGYEKYSKRIQKTLYYGVAASDRPSFPMTGLLVEKFNRFCNKEKLDRLDIHTASSLCYASYVTPCVVIISLLYLDRLRKNNPEYLEYASPSQVFTVAMMVASKYLYDDVDETEIYNDEWAASADMLTMELNEAEVEFLFAIDWDLHIDFKTFLDALVYLEAEVAKQQALKQGFFTYTDLTTLSQVLPPLWSTIISVLSSTLAVCFVGYVTTILSVTLGSLAAFKCNSYLTSEMLNLGQQLYVSKDVPKLHSSRTHFGDNETCLEENRLCHSLTSETEILSDIGLSFENKKVEPPPLPLPASARFSTLRTLTAAILLASSASGHRHSSFSSTYQDRGFLSPYHPMLPPYSFGHFLNDSPIEISAEDFCYSSRGILDFLSPCWNCNVIRNSFYCNDSEKDFPRSRSGTCWSNKGRTFSRKRPDCHLRKRTRNNGMQRANALSYPVEMTSMDNLTQIIFRSEFTSLTTGQYSLPSGKKVLSHKDLFVPPEKSNLSICLGCLRKEEESPSSPNLVHAQWMEDVVMFLQWKALPVDGSDRSISLGHFEPSSKPITMPT